MTGLRPIIGSGLRRAVVPAVLAASLAVAVAIPALLLPSRAQGAGGRSIEVRKAHHEACHRIPEEVYHRGHFRAIKGRVIDPDGRPIAGALVCCAKLESLVELARGAPPLPSKWNVPIEAETRTDDRGRYEFPHLPVGGRTLFYSAPAGRDLAPAVKDLVVVQDGLGAQLDVTLARPATLTVRLRGPVKEWTRVYLVPQRWWPGLESAKIPAGWRTAEFRRVGGPFRKGLIAATGWEESSPLRIVGRYDLARSAEVVLAGHEMPVTRHDLPEAAGIEPWRFEPSTEERLFYAAMSPVPLFWRASASGWPSWLPVPSLLKRLGGTGPLVGLLAAGRVRAAGGSRADSAAVAVSEGGGEGRCEPRMDGGDAIRGRARRTRTPPPRGLICLSASIPFIRGSNHPRAPGNGKGNITERKMGNGKWDITNKSDYACSNADRVYLLYPLFVYLCTLFLSVSPFPLLAHSNGTERPLMQAAAMRVWNPRNSVQSELTSSFFFRLRTSLLITSAMPSATSIRGLQANRQARLMALLAVIGPAISRPICARLGRSQRMAAATNTARVFD